MHGASRLMAGLLAAGALLGAAGVFAAAAATAEPGDSLAVARTAIDQGRHAEAIALLRGYLQADGGTAGQAHGSYLLGLALFGQTDAELTRLRGQKLQRIDFLEPGQAEQLRESLALLQKAAELAPQTAFAPEAAYLAARVQDWGYLKRFEDARKAYQVVVDRYPGTESARKAAERIEYWNNLFRHGGSKPGTPVPGVH